MWKLFIQSLCINIYTPVELGQVEKKSSSLKHIIIVIMIILYRNEKAKNYGRNIIVNRIVPLRLSRIKEDQPSKFCVQENVYLQKKIIKRFFVNVYTKSRRHICTTSVGMYTTLWKRPPFSTRERKNKQMWVYARPRDKHLVQVSAGA